MTPTEDATAGLERWKCGDYFDGCGFLATGCVTLTANVRNGTGEVEFDGFAERTRFRIQGVSGQPIWQKLDTVGGTGGCYDNWECRPSCGEAGLTGWGVAENNYTNIGF